MKSKTQSKRKSFSFHFPKLSWKKDFNAKSETVLSGKKIAFFTCSFVSAFINLVFISNLTKSPYTIGTLFSMPAAIFLGVLSIALDITKVVHVVQINTLDELGRRLHDQPWVQNVKNVRKRWHRMYILYVALSIITSVSLSTISIGEGIHRNQTMIDTINKDISKLQKFYDIGTESDNIELKSAIKSVQNSDNAVTTAQTTFAKVDGLIKEYRQERADFQVIAEFGSRTPVIWKGSEIIPNDYWTKRNNKIQADVAAAGISLTITQIRNMSDTDIQMKIKQSMEKLTSNTASAEVKSLSEMNKSKYKQEIENLNGKYFLPSTWGKGGEIKGEAVTFDIENLSGAIATLEALRVKYENDSGDIGSSSKIFMQIGSTINSIRAKNKPDNLDEIVNEEKTASSFGSTELMLMAMLLFLSLLCEVAINQCSPKINISRRILGQFSQYYPKDFDVNIFMLHYVYTLREFDAITENDFDKEVARCEKHIVARNHLDEKIKELLSGRAEVKTQSKEPKVIVKEVPVEKVVEKVIEKPVETIVEKQAEYSTDVDNLVKEIEDII